MARLLGLLLFVVVLAFVAIAMGNWPSHQPKSAVATVSPSGHSEIVALRDRSTLHVAEGTVGRDLVDWLASGEATSRKFELGGYQFVGRTAEPTPETMGRATRLVALLKAYPDVVVTVVGHSDRSADAEADHALSLARAQRLVQLLASGGIRPERLQAEGHGSSEPLAEDGPRAGRDRNHRVSLILRR
jgi:outer membrane protein OmpA-like peptidoglycan-associated protein